MTSRTVKKVACVLVCLFVACGPAYGTPERSAGSTPIRYPYVRHVVVNGHDCAYTVNWYGGPITGYEVATALACP